MRDNRQQSTKMTDAEQKERDIRELTAEYELLKDIKEIMDMPSGAGKRVLLSIIAHTDPMADPFTNNGYTAFQLGVQSVGRKVIKGITDAGFKLNVVDIMRNQNVRRIDVVNNLIKKLQQEDTK